MTATLTPTDAGTTNAWQYPAEGTPAAGTDQVFIGGRRVDYDPDQLRPVFVHGRLKLRLPPSVAVLVGTTGDTTLWLARVS